jgi:hypothetical protein
MIESFRNNPAKFEVIAKIRWYNASIFEPDLQFSNGVFSSIREAKAAFFDELSGFDLNDYFSNYEINDGLILRLGSTDLFGGGFCEIENFPIVYCDNGLVV